jgi:hypothetical protein
MYVQYMNRNAHVCTMYVQYMNRNALVCTMYVQYINRNALACTMHVQCMYSMYCVCTVHILKHLCPYILCQGNVLGINTYLYSNAGVYTSSSNSVNLLPLHSIQKLGYCLFLVVSIWSPLEKFFVLYARIAIPLIIICDRRLHRHRTTRLHVFITA